MTPESEKTKTPGTDLTKTEGLEEKQIVNEAKTTEKSVETAKLEQRKLVVVANIKPAEVKIIETKNENAVHDKAQSKLVEEKTDDSGIANDDNDLINLNSK